MCGITVSIALGRGSPSQSTGQANGHTGDTQGVHPGCEATSLEDQLHKSLDLIAHRGPDAKGVWISDDGRVGEETHAPPHPIS